MPRIAEQDGPVTGGVDTHADVHVAAVVDQVGRVLGTQAFPATAAGYRAALAWMRAHGELVKVGVEGTGSYGAGLARYLAACRVEVAEVIRPNRQARRQRGKSDAADAVAAAVAALSGEASGMPKSRDGAAESIRALKVTRAGAVKARTQAGNQLRDLILTAPEPVRQQLAGLSCQRQVDVAARFRPGGPACPAEGAKAAMASVARRHQQLTAEIARLDTMLEELVRHAAPEGFLAKRGVATQVAAALLVTAGDNPGRVRREASFAALCGASPVDASSGKQIRHRLNRGGDRQANSALWTIAMTRLAHDPRTKAYAARRTAEGKTRKEIIRCLKRYIAREIYKALCRPPQPGTASAPQAKQDLSVRVLT
ncbi:MAG: IS110 family transposase [Micromonosporaceae bacterium]